LTRLPAIVWRQLGGVRLTVVVLLLLVVDCAMGYWSLRGNNTVFAPLNDVGLFPWARTYGMNDLIHTAWFFTLLALLFILAINTFVCATDRVIALFKSRSRFTRPGRFALKFAPHIMHYAVIVILTGYLSSYLFSDVYPSQTLAPGTAITVPGTRVRLEFLSFDYQYYEGKRLEFFEDRVLSPEARLKLSNGVTERTAAISLNRPVRYEGYGVFMKNFAPKKRGRKNISRPYVEVSIRKDPGVSFYFTGMALFSLGLVMYAYQWLFVKAHGEERQ